MELIYNSVFLEHDTGMHPENRKRLESLGKLPETRVENGEKYLTLVHSQDYIDRVKQACARGEHLDADTATSPGSYNAAVHAAGATVMASQTGGFALVRPPGHHAYPSRSSGFCIFNNIAVAVQKLVNEGKKVFIFDFDAHLGDGTVKIFYDSDRVLYWSLHQYPAFPGGGYSDEIGSGNGTGYTMNIPLPPGSGDDIFTDAMQRFMPVAEKFKPDVVAVSAGFDAHQYDLLLELRLSTNMYYDIGRMLASKFRSIFATLEGGYNIEIFPKCLYNFVDGINGRPMRFEEKKTESMIQVRDEYEMRIYKLEKELKEIWKV